MKYIQQITTMFVLLGLALLVGCTDSAPSDLPKAGLGGVAITKYVAVGNSLTAGYQSAGLFKSAQKYSFPNLIAQQLTAAGANLGTFEQPYWPDPGNPDPATGKAARYVIVSLADPDNPVIGPAGETVTAAAPENVTLPRPFDNLGLPGAPLAGFTDTVGTYQGGFGPAIIRGANGLPKSQYKSTIALQPQLVTFWLGANDVLGYATSGGVSPSAPTDVTTIFTPLYTQAIGLLKASIPNVKIVVATIPDVRSIPFFTTLGPKIGATIAKIPGAVLVYQTGAGGIATTSFTNPATDPLICLTGSPYASLLGTKTGKYWWDHGYPPSAVGIDTTQPFGFSATNPWPNSLTLDAAEQTIAGNAVTAFNASIKSIAAANGAAIVDVYAVFNDIKANGYEAGGVEYTTDYVTGGIFSLDGVHPTDRGYGMIANWFIKAINEKFGTSITGVDLSKLPALNTPLAKYMANSKTIPVVAPHNWDSFLNLWQQ